MFAWGALRGYKRNIRQLRQLETQWTACIWVSPTRVLGAPEQSPASAPHWHNDLPSCCLQAAVHKKPQGRYVLVRTTETENPTDCGPPNRNSQSSIIYNAVSSGRSSRPISSVTSSLLFPSSTRIETSQAVNKSVTLISAVAPRTPGSNIDPTHFFHEGPGVVVHSSATVSHASSWS